MGASADLSITKSVTPGTVVPGGTITYSIVLANAGPSVASSATLSDTFPSSLQNLAVVDDGPYACAPLAGSTLTCTIGTHAVGMSATITITGTLTAGTYADFTLVPNTTSISSTTPDPNTANNKSTATFTIRSTPVIRATKTATPSTVPEPGGDVTFSVTVSNPGDVAVTLTTLVDSVHGDLAGKGTCAVAQPVPPGGSYACSFSVFVGGNAGRIETDIVTASASTSDGRLATASDDATVTVTNVLPAIALTKTASVTELPAPGGDVTYWVTIRNLVAESLIIVALADDAFGDLDDPGNEAVEDSSCVGLVGDSLPGGALLECQFTARVTGDAGDRHINVVTATVKDDDEVSPAHRMGSSPSAVTVVSAEARAVVRIVAADAGGQGDGGGGQPPTDMLASSDARAAVHKGGSPIDGSSSWAIWVLLTAMLILTGAWILRRQRYSGK